MSENHPVHILMPAYNVSSFIGSSLSSILNQDYINITTIIIDDASSDSTKDEIQRFTNNNSSIKAFFDSQNKGIATRRDELINLSKDIDPNSFFLWLDADDTINDPKFISKLIHQMIRTKADICLYSFEIDYETDSLDLRTNANGLLKDRKNSEKILADICKSTDQVVSVESYPPVATYTSLGWTKAYAPSVKTIWPSSNHNYIYEDFAYMAVLFHAKRITGLKPRYRPINYIRRANSATGHRVSKHFYHDIIRQLTKFKANLGILSPQEDIAADQFVNNKLLQYEITLRALIEAGTNGFSKDDLLSFQKAKDLI